MDASESVIPAGLSFAPPEFESPLDVDGVVRAVPDTALIKGFFLESMEKMVLEQRPDLKGKLYEGMPRQKYKPFVSYKRSEAMRVEAHLAHLLYPDVTLREGLRRVCHRIYPQFLSSLLGRVVLVALFSGDVDAVLGAGPKMMAAVTSFGKVDAKRLGERHWLYHYRDYYSWLDSGDVGIIEGLLRHYNVEPQLTLAMPSTFEMWLDIRWKPA